MEYEIIDAKQALINYLTQNNDEYIFTIIDKEDKFIIDISEIDVEVVKTHPESYIVIVKKNTNKI